MLKDMLERLPSVFNKDEDSNVGKLLDIFSDEVTEIRENIERIKLWRDIDKAKGDVLDKIGLNVGQPRNGHGDTLYRVMIKTRIAANLSGGEMPVINEVMKVILGEHYIGTIELYNKPEYDNQPAAIIIQSNNAPTFIGEEGEEIVRDDILDIARRIVAAGVGVDWIIPMYVASPIISATNDITHQINQRIENGIQAENNVLYNLNIGFEQKHTNWLDGHHLLNARTILDGEREFCVNKVYIQEVL